MRIVPTPLSDAVLATGMPAFHDHRGSFRRVFCQSLFSAESCPFEVRQINLSRTTTQGALRGMHFQQGQAAEDKLVTCLKGEIFDVAVDLRAGSDTYGAWHGVKLSGETPQSFLIPKGFAHGFQALTADVEMLYLMSADYDPTAEAGLHYACPKTAIKWPLPIVDLSERDKTHPQLDDITPVSLS
ncbi:MAG: dTDP-4-dehydrorhamnose 3,5-epimerase family protein [Paracoccaceae bacterium]